MAGPWYRDSDAGIVAQFLEKKYFADLVRDRQNTYVDGIGRVRWALEYGLLREQGQSHPQALKAINRMINVAAGLPLDAWPGDEWRPDPRPDPQPPHRPADVRAFRSDFLGRWDRPLLMWGGMGPADQAEQITWLHAHDYHTVPLALHNDYPRYPQWHWDWWDTPELARLACVRLTSEGLVPLVVLHPRAGWDIRRHLDAVRRVWPSLASSVPLVMWGWEINDLGGEWANGSRQLDYLDTLHAITGVPICVHFTPERWAGWPGFDHEEQDRDEVEWLRQAKQRGVLGLCYQEPPDKSEADVLERMLHLPSPHGWSPGICGRVTDGAGLLFYAFEFARDEARHQRIVERLSQDARVAGWC